MIKPNRIMIAKWAALPLLVLAAHTVAASPDAPSDPFSALNIYNGDWSVRATHPWSGAPAGATDRLLSRCRRFTLYFACEQTVNGKPQTLIVYTIGEGVGRFNTRTIAPNGLAGARGDLTLAGKHWTYLDKPSATLKGPWSRVENIIVDDDHIKFEEFESNDEGATWNKSNEGVEERIVGVNRRSSG